MTAKDKAKELINTFYQPLGLLMCGVSSDTMWEYSKECSLKCLDEIEKALISYGTNTFELQNMDAEFRYLDILRSEITNL